MVVHGTTRLNINKFGTLIGEHLKVQVCTQICYFCVYFFELKEFYLHCNCH